MTAPPVPILPPEIHGTKVLALMQCWSGDLDEGQAVLAPLRQSGLVVGDGVGVRPFVDAQAFLDATYEKGARNYWRSHNHDRLGVGLINDLVDLAADLPTAESDILICQLGGAIDDVSVDATAYPHRDVAFMTTPGVRWRAHEDDDRCIGWLKRASARLAAHARPGAYVNFIAEREGRAHDAYGPNEHRLAEIKRIYDPDNMFRINQNIVPAADG